MQLVLANNAKTTLADNISSTATTLYVDSDETFPLMVSGDYFYCTIQNQSNQIEIVKVTAIASNRFTVERGQENTIAIPFLAGAVVELRMTVQNLEDHFSQAATDAADVLVDAAILSHIGVDIQAYSANLTTYAGIAPAANVQSILGAADYSAIRTLLGLGSAALLSSSAVFQVANNLSEGTAATMRTNLGLGTAALANTGTSGATLSYLNGANTWSGVNIFSVGSGQTTAQQFINTYDSVLVRALWVAGARSGTPAVNDTAYIGFGLKNASGTTVEVARLNWTLWDNVAATEDGAFQLDMLINGTMTARYGFYNSTFKTLANNVASLGDTSNGWSALYLASGGVINFNNGNVTLTHSADLLTLNKTLKVNNTGAASQLTVGGSNSFDSNLFLDSNAGFNRQYYARTAGVNRWAFGSDTTAESGANAGSNFSISRFDDAGTWIASALYISRSNGNITVGGTILPATTATYALGANSLGWTYLYLTASATYPQAVMTRTDTHGSGAYVGLHNYYGRDSLGNSQQYGYFTAYCTTATDGAETGEFRWSLANAGTNAERMSLKPTALMPSTNDGLALGTSAVMWSDLFLASGGVINFNNGDASLTHGTTSGGSIVANNGTVTTSKPIMGFSQTWNNVATTFTGILVNITNTTSADGSLVQDWQIGGTSKASVVRGPAAYGNNVGFIVPTNNTNGVVIVPAGFYLGANAAVNWQSAGLTASNWSTTDLSLVRDAANTLALRNSTNAQAFRLYNTYTDASNYERAILNWNTNVLEIGTSKLGTGSTRNLKFLIGDANQLDYGITNAGKWTSASDVIVPAGKEQVWIPAAAMKPRTTNGCAALATTETTTNKVNIETLDFDATAAEYAQFTIRVPKRWGTNTVKATFYWKHAATATNFGVVWGLQAGSFGDNEALDTAFGTAQTVTDTGGTTNNHYISAQSAAITIANLTAEEMVYFQVYRDATNVSDTLAIDAGLIGVMLEFTTTGKLNDN